MEEAVLEAVDDPQLHRRTQRFYEFAHQGDYKFLDFEKLKETHFVQGQRRGDVRTAYQGCKSIPAIYRAWATIPNAPTPIEPIQRPVGDLPDVWDDQPGDARFSSACAAFCMNRISRNFTRTGLLRIKSFGPWVSIRPRSSWSTRIHRMMSCLPYEGLLMMMRRGLAAGSPWKRTPTTTTPGCASTSRD